MYALVTLTILSAASAMAASVPPECMEEIKDKMSLVLAQSRGTRDHATFMRQVMRQIDKSKCQNVQRFRLNMGDFSYDHDLNNDKDYNDASNEQITNSDEEIEYYDSEYKPNPYKSSQKPPPNSRKSNISDYQEEKQRGKFDNDDSHSNTNENTEYDYLDHYSNEKYGERKKVTNENPNTNSNQNLNWKDKPTQISKKPNKNRYQNDSKNGHFDDDNTTQMSSEQNENSDKNGEHTVKNTDSLAQTTERSKDVHTKQDKISNSGESNKPVQNPNAQNEKYDNDWKNVDHTTEKIESHEKYAVNHETSTEINVNQTDKPEVNKRNLNSYSTKAPDKTTASHGDPNYQNNNFDTSTAHPETEGAKILTTEPQNVYTTSKPTQNKAIDKVQIETSTRDGELKTDTVSDTDNKDTSNTDALQKIDVLQNNNLTDNIKNVIEITSNTNIDKQDQETKPFVSFAFWLNDDPNQKSNLIIKSELNSEKENINIIWASVTNVVNTLTEWTSNIYKVLSSFAHFA